VSPRLRLPFASLGMLVCFVAANVRSANPVAATAAEVPISPLRTVSTVPLSLGSYFAWSGPSLCDEDQNLYFLVMPRPQSPNGTTKPREVVRISADGKTKTTFDPAASSKFVGAEEVTTTGMALDQAGRLFTLVWARWVEKGSQAEKGRQYIVSFDRKGEYRSHFEVDWEELLIQQFAVFGSGQFLMRGVRPHSGETRMAIASSGGQTLEDVRGWGGDLSKVLDDPDQLEFGPIVRGGDGRIYVTQKDAQQGRDVVHALGPSGESEEVFKLRPMVRDSRLMGWRAAGDQFAAEYLEAGHEAEGASSGDQKGRWWIAVYGSSGDGVELKSVYGPAPGPPVCYQHTASADRFSFLKDAATVVTMASTR
jgi:hypothetical protein